MRCLYLIISALLLFGGAWDVVIAVDAAGLTAAEAGEEPWLTSPCVNPEHFYLRPLYTKNNETYPAALDGGWESVRLSFTRPFLHETQARGFRPWECHFMYDGNGEPVHVDNVGECVYANMLCREMAEDISRAVLGACEENRVALTFAGERFDTRFCVNFTRDTEKLINALYAAPGAVYGDMATATEKALDYFERRSADERRCRKAAVIIISADGERARESIAALKKARPDVTALYIGVMPGRAGSKDAVIQARPVRRWAYRFSPTSPFAR